MQDSDHLREKISTPENQIDVMAKQYQKPTGRKIRMYKRIIFSCTQQQFKALNIAAAKKCQSLSYYTVLSLVPLLLLLHQRR